MDSLDQPVDAPQALQDRHDLTDPAQCATVPLAEAIAARLERHARHAQGALAPEAERALRKAARAFTGWAAAQSLVALPATAETVAAYVDALAAQGRKKLYAIKLFTAPRFGRRSAAR